MATESLERVCDVFRGVVTAGSQWLDSVRRAKKLRDSSRQLDPEEEDRLVEGVLQPDGVAFEAAIADLDAICLIDKDRCLLDADRCIAETRRLPPRQWAASVIDCAAVIERNWGYSLLKSQDKYFVKAMHDLGAHWKTAEIELRLRAVNPANDANGVNAMQMMTADPPATAASSDTERGTKGNRRAWLKLEPPPNDWCELHIEGNLGQIAKWTGLSEEALRNNNGSGIWIREINYRKFSAWFPTRDEYSIVNGKRRDEEAAAKTVQNQPNPAKTERYRKL